MNTAPLQGIKVVDFTEVQSGPSCTQMLAWLGADVIKIERPGVGDATRKELQFNPDLPSYYYLQLNSDKKSLTLDAKTPDGKEILTKLIQQADMFVENLHPGAMDKLGFSWDVVHKLNPRCIYGTIKGFPVSSKYKDLKAYEPIAQVTAAVKYRHASAYRPAGCFAAARAYRRGIICLPIHAQCMFEPMPNQDPRPVNP